MPRRFVERGGAVFAAVDECRQLVLEGVFTFDYIGTTQFESKASLMKSITGRSCSCDRGKSACSLSIICQVLIYIAFIVSIGFPLSSTTLPPPLIIAVCHFVALGKCFNGSKCMEWEKSPFRTLGKDLVVYTGLEMSFLTMLLILLLRYKARYIDSLYRNYLKY